jgi:6-phosphogluconate dehydrogenase
MKIAVTGLGRMGMQIARKLAENGHDVIAHNRSRGPVDTSVGYGATAAYKKQDVVDAFKGEQLVLWLMIPAEIIDDQLDEWLTIVPRGSILIDGGNSDFRGDKARAERVTAKGSTLLDIGTSGGVWGYQNGFAMMVGGDKLDLRKTSPPPDAANAWRESVFSERGEAVASSNEEKQIMGGSGKSGAIGILGKSSKSAFQIIEPALKTLAAPEGAYQLFGPNGAGHYVKMVHNAIEYGMMESLAEGYRMLHDGPFPGLDLAAAGEVWQHHSVVTSWLNELCRDALLENPRLDGIDGYVAESGEARWTLETAKELGIPLPSIQASFDVRLASQQGDVSFATKLLAAMRNRFGGHELNKN